MHFFVGDQVCGFEKMKRTKNLMQVGQKQVVGSVVHVQLLYQGVPAKNAHHYLLEILLTSSNFQKLFLLFELVRQFTVPGHVFKSLDVVLVRRHE